MVTEGRPVYVRNERDRANDVPGVGEQFANHGRRTVEELDSVLHVGLARV
jgi:hypothetical protein